MYLNRMKKACGCCKVLSEDGSNLSIVSIGWYRFWYQSVFSCGQLDLGRFFLASGDATLFSENGIIPKALTFSFIVYRVGFAPAPPVSHHWFLDKRGLFGCLSRVQAFELQGIWELLLTHFLTSRQGSSNRTPYLELRTHAVPKSDRVPFFICGALLTWHTRWETDKLTGLGQSFNGDSLPMWSEQTHPGGDQMLRTCVTGLPPTSHRPYTEEWSLLRPVLSVRHKHWLMKLLDPKVKHCIVQCVVYTSYAYLSGSVLEHH